MKTVFSLQTVKIPWLPSCCSHCNFLGHSDTTCLKVYGELVRHVAGLGKGSKWRVKSALVASLIATVATEVATDDYALQAALDLVVEPIPTIAIGGYELIGDVSDELATLGDACICPVLQEVTSNVEENQVQIGNVALQVDKFPPLQSPSLKKSKQRGGAGKTPTLVGSKNKFEILNEITNEVSIESRKPRVASLGVANLLQELKTKKTDKIKSNGSKASSSFVGHTIVQ
ncbi:hypothetical protein V6N11_040220 [Hibiscus sabdariffa]|uniref:Uncharacterized protein n=1 Tax=Hibiscus sabdariffa TaxID=183260 RepID=A0ABR2RGV5_9ROSI